MAERGTELDRRLRAVLARRGVEVPDDLEVEAECYEDTYDGLCIQIVVTYDGYIKTYSFQTLEHLLTEVLA